MVVRLANRFEAARGRPRVVAGRTWYVTTLTGVVPVDLTAGTAGQVIRIGAVAEAIAITPDGTTAYGVSPGYGEVIPIDLGTGTAGQPISVGEGPAAIAISP